MVSYKQNNIGDYGDEFFICLEGSYGVNVPRKVRIEDNHSIDSHDVAKESTENGEVRNDITPIISF